MAGLRPQAPGRGGAEGAAEEFFKSERRLEHAAPGGPRRPRGGVAQRLPDLRSDRDRGPRAGVDGVRRRRDAARRPPGARAARAQGSPGHRLAVPRRSRSHPQGRARPPRHQTREHHADPGGSSRGDGLRARPPGDRRRRLGFRHPRLHVARAGGRPDPRRRGPTSTPPAWSSPKW